VATSATLAARARSRSRLIGALEALFGLLECRHQRFGAAGERALLKRSAQARVDVGDEVLVARASHRLHELLELAALHCHLVQARLEQGHLGHRLACAFLGLAGQQIGFTRDTRAVLLALGEIALAAPDAIVGSPGQQQREHREEGDDHRENRERSPGQPPSRQGRPLHEHGRRQVFDHGRIDCRQATTAASPAPASSTRPKPARRARAAMRGCVATAHASAQRP